MENTPNVSSEEELLELRNEGKISEDEYEQLRGAMRRSTKLDVEPPTAVADKAKSKRKLGKIAFCLMLVGIVVVPVWFWVMEYPTTAPEYRVPPAKRMVVGPNGEKFTDPIGEKFAEVALGEQRTGFPPWLAGLTLILEIAAFAMGVIAWPDAFVKATVVTISFIIAIAFLCVIAF